VSREIGGRRETAPSERSPTRNPYRYDSQPFASLYGARTQVDRHEASRYKCGSFTRVWSHAARAELRPAEFGRFHNLPRQSSGFTKSERRVQRGWGATSSTAASAAMRARTVSPAGSTSVTAAGTTRVSRSGRSEPDTALLGAPGLDARCGAPVPITPSHFPTHGPLSAAQGNLTSCLNFDFAILNLFEPSAL
jgi:hypothetical protein